MERGSDWLRGRRNTRHARPVPARCGERSQQPLSRSNPDSGSSDLQEQGGRKTLSSPTRGASAPGTRVENLFPSCWAARSRRYELDSVAEASELADHVRRARAKALFGDCGTTFLVDDTLAQNLPDQSTETVSNRPDGLEVPETRDQTAVHKLKDTALCFDRRIGRGREETAHLAVPFGRSMTVADACTFIVARAGTDPRGEVLRRREGGRRRPDLRDNLLRGIHPQPWHGRQPLHSILMRLKVVAPSLGSTWVASECRSSCGLQRLRMPARRAATTQASHRTFGVMGLSHVTRGRCRETATSSAASTGSTRAASRAASG